MLAAPRHDSSKSAERFRSITMFTGFTRIVATRLDFGLLTCALACFPPVGRQLTMVEWCQGGLPGTLRTASAGLLIVDTSGLPLRLCPPKQCVKSVVDPIGGSAVNSTAVARQVVTGAERLDFLIEAIHSYCDFSYITLRNVVRRRWSTRSIAESPGGLGDATQAPSDGMRRKSDGIHWQLPPERWCKAAR